MLAQDKYIVSPPHSLLSLYLRQKEQISYIYSIYVCSQAKKIMYGCYYLNFLGMTKKILAYENLCFFGQPSPQNTANFRMFIIYWWFTNIRGICSMNFRMPRFFGFVYKLEDANYAGQREEGVERIGIASPYAAKQTKSAML